MASPDKVIVGYWGIRGNAGPIRSLLAYCGISFKNKLYSDPEEWFHKDKQTLGFKYPNLPYLIDGDKKITETLAILHYIPLRAGKKELLGNTDDKFVEVEEVLGVVSEARTELSNILRSKDDFVFAEEDAFAKGGLKSKLETLNKNLEGQEWLTGFLSIADFLLVELLDLISRVDAPKLEAYPNLVNLQRRFIELPEIKAHRQSENFIKV
jgi:glutathione S-transferase